MENVTRADRFWAKVQKTETCWLWTGAKSRGYGYFNIGDHQDLAHRVAYRWLVGPIAAGTEIDHLCRVKNCVRPDHLEAVTHKLNLRRSDEVTGKRSARTHCPQGHPYDEANTHRSADGRRHCLICRRANQTRTRAAKPKKPHARGERMGSARLMWEQVTEIRRRFQAGETNKSALAREYGVAQPTIGRVVGGKGWRESGRI